MRAILKWIAVIFIPIGLIIFIQLKFKHDVRHKGVIVDKYYTPDLGSHITDYFLVVQENGQSEREVLNSEKGEYANFDKGDSIEWTTNEWNIGEQSSDQQ